MDVRRFGPQYASRGYCLARTDEVYRTYYDIVFPNHERQAGRPLRTPPAYDRHAALGAVFGEKSGWERVNWYGSNEDPAHERFRPRGLGGRALVDRDRHRAPRDAATPPALFDESSFAKIEVSGPGAPAFLEPLCANHVDQPVGSITYTSMLNHRGGIECDFTVTRLGAERFLIVTGTAFGRHDRSWIEQHAPGRRLGGGPRRHGRAGVPRALGAAGREILAACATTTCRSRTCGRARITVGDVPCWALRVTYVGELGWELYPSAEYGVAPVGHADRGRPATRAGSRRLPGDRLAAAGEGLPRVGCRHHVRDRPVLGRARVRRTHRQGVPRSCRAAGGERRSARLACLVLDDPALGRARQRAGAHTDRRGGRPGLQRRAGLFDGALDRLRLAPRRARRRARVSPSRCSANPSARRRPSPCSTRPEPGSAPEPRSAWCRSARGRGTPDVIIASDKLSNVAHDRQLDDLRIPSRVSPTSQGDRFRCAAAARWSRTPSWSADRAAALYAAHASRSTTTTCSRISGPLCAGPRGVEPPTVGSPRSREQSPPMTSSAARRHRGGHASYDGGVRSRPEVVVSTARHCGSRPAGDVAHQGVPRGAAQPGPRLSRRRRLADRSACLTRRATRRHRRLLPGPFRRGRLGAHCGRRPPVRSTPATSR